MGLYIPGVSMPKDGLARNISIFEDGSVRYYGGSRVIGSAIERGINMGIYIPIEMPKPGECIVVYGDGEVWHHGKRIAKVGTAIELPPHGDLIDRNHLEVVSYHNSEGMEDTFDNGVKWMLEYIDKLTPVIPAEEGGDDG